MAKTYDVVLIGGGHNALVCAAYLARAGKSVCVLERRELVGGACVSEEIWPGYKVSTAAYVNSLLRPEIIQRARTEALRLRAAAPQPVVVLAVPGRPLSHDGPRQGDDASRGRQVLAQGRRRASQIRGDARRAAPTSSSRRSCKRRPIPGHAAADFAASWQARHGSSRRLGPDGAAAIEILTGAARPILDRWFESEQPQGDAGDRRGHRCDGLAVDAGHGVCPLPSRHGRVQRRARRVGLCRAAAWAASATSIAAAAQAKGAEIRMNAEVARILVKDGRAAGVVLKDGTEFRGNTVASGADANVTFLKLWRRRICRRISFPAVKGLDYSSASLKINVALSELAELHVGARRAGGPAASRHDPHLARLGLHRARLRRCEIRPAVGARSSSARCPRSIDQTVAPAGTALMSMFIQYFPYNAEGRRHARGVQRGEGEVRRPLLRYPRTNTRRTSRTRSSTGRCSRRATLRRATASPAATSCRGDVAERLFFMRPLPG